MLRSGLIVGAVMLVAGGGLAYLFPLCVPCLAVVAGALAGYLAGVWERPANNGRAVQRGALAGAIGGAGAVLGHVAGGLLAAVTVGPQGAADVARQLGLDLGAGAEATPAVFYTTAGLTACCFGVVEVGLMAGLGALGGLLYWQMTGRAQAGGPQPPAFSA
ncbi:MAG: hypothetical protein KA764_10270 [Anaerolineales bacterium]|nr:hypothetical protein [Anaerolineales bacterium]